MSATCWFGDYQDDHGDDEDNQDDQGDEDNQDERWWLLLMTDDEGDGKYRRKYDDGEFEKDADEAWE